MTEEQAQAWIRDHFGDEAFDTVAAFLELLVEESGRQNLISAKTLDTIWDRHVVDSAQLITHAPPGSMWLDVGTGAGFPGLVIGILQRTPILLVEPRRRRADFLKAAAAALRLDNVHVQQCHVERMRDMKPAIISARAVAAIGAILDGTSQLRTPDTTYILPRGRSIDLELEEVRTHWHGVFHVEHSVTDPASGILIAREVRRR